MQVRQYLSDERVQKNQRVAKTVLIVNLIKYCVHCELLLMNMVASYTSTQPTCLRPWLYKPREQKVYVSIQHKVYEAYIMILSGVIDIQCTRIFVGIYVRGTIIDRIKVNSYSNR